MVKEGLREIRSGINAIELKNGMKKAGSLVIDELARIRNHSIHKKKSNKLLTISAQDSEVGKIIADAMEKSGRMVSSRLRKEKPLD